MYKTFETAQYVDDHRQKVMEFTNKVNRIIKATFGENPDVKAFIQEADKRALNHDMDKFNKYRTLELYSARDEIDNEKDKKEYQQSHKTTQRHHVDYFIGKGIDMNLNDIYEMMADVYSSTLLRHKKAYDELLEEQEKGKFSDEYLAHILNTFGLVNLRFKGDIQSKFPKLNKTKSLIDLIRLNVIQKKELPKFINSKK